MIYKVDIIGHYDISSEWRTQDLPTYLPNHILWTPNPDLSILGQLSYPFF